MPIGGRPNGGRSGRLGSGGASQDPPFLLQAQLARTRCLALSRGGLLGQPLKRALHGVAALQAERGVLQSSTAGLERLPGCLALPVKEPLEPDVQCIPLRCARRSLALLQPLRQANLLGAGCMGMSALRQVQRFPGLQLPVRVVGGQRLLCAQGGLQPLSAGSHGAPLRNSASASAARVAARLACVPGAWARKSLMRDQF